MQRHVGQQVSRRAREQIRRRLLWRFLPGFGRGVQASVGAHDALPAWRSAMKFLGAEKCSNCITFVRNALFALRFVSAAGIVLQQHLGSCIKAVCDCLFPGPVEMATHQPDGASAMLPYEPSRTMALERCKGSSSNHKCAHWGCISKLLRWSPILGASGAAEVAPAAGGSEKVDAVSKGCAVGSGVQSVAGFDGSRVPCEQSRPSVSHL